MLIEIGSNFWITPKEMQGEIKIISPAIFNCVGSDYVWFSTGRSATSYVIRTIEERYTNTKKVVCLPSFTCHTVYEPFVNAGYKVVTLPIKKDLTSSAEDICAVIENSDAGIVLFHKYFGFETLPNINTIIPKLRDRGIIIIEDCTQSMYSDIERIDADFYIGSIRKWCGVPDGGFAVCKEGSFNNKPTRYDIELETRKKEASEKKYDYLFRYRGQKQDFLQCYRDAEDTLNSQHECYTISDLSKIVQANLDIEDMSQKRRSNYTTLLEELNEIPTIKPIFNTLPNDVVPLYLPILCDNRDEIQRLLVKNAIYAPIVWPKGTSCPVVDSDANHLYEHLLCIPIDQRYSEDDIRRIGFVLRHEEIVVGWMTWEELLPYKNQLVDMEHELMIRYHYPDWDIPKEYPITRVNNLEQHLLSGNTHFFGIRRANDLLGYIWVYTSDFIDKIRLHVRSILIKDYVKSEGYGQLLFKEIENKAIELGCDEICTSYVPQNKTMERCVERYGYERTRIEMVKQVKK